MGSSDPPIVVTGGSVTIEFNESDFSSPAKGRHTNASKKIKRVEVTGEGIDFAENIPNGKVTVKIFYSNP
ncbi:MAG TPA: hypothetical protein VGX48_05505 [Pyrinomonadaceae bacterium]|jgi:hypothetical protein|nr:hypothetical protein [Pyrinomonadaceae bacterium]